VVQASLVAAAVVGSMLSLVAGALLLCVPHAVGRIEYYYGWRCKCMTEPQAWRRSTQCVADQT
jgi:hypothetical protein